MLKKLAILVAAASLATPALADNWLGQAQEINKIQIGKRDPGARRMMIKSGTTPANRTVSYPVRLEAGKFYGFMADCDYECNEAVEFAGFQTHRERQIDPDSKRPRNRELLPT